MYRPEGWQNPHIESGYTVGANNVTPIQHKAYEAGADAIGVQTACLVLNIMFYKVPSINGDKSGQWWEAELRDKDIPIKWNERLGEFIPEEKDATE